MSKRFEHFTKEYIQKAVKCLIRYTISLAIRETQIKTMIRYYNISIRMSKTITDNTKGWQACRATGTLIHHSWECKTVPLLWKAVGSLLQRYT